MAVLKTISPKEVPVAPIATPRQTVPSSRTSNPSLISPPPPALFMIGAISSGQGSWLPVSIVADVARASQAINASRPAGTPAPGSTGPTQTAPSSPLDANQRPLGENIKFSG